MAPPRSPRRSGCLRGAPGASGARNIFVASSAPVRNRPRCYSTRPGLSRSSMASPLRIGPASRGVSTGRAPHHLHPAPMAGAESLGIPRPIFASRSNAVHGGSPAAVDRPRDISPALPRAVPRFSTKHASSRAAQDRTAGRAEHARADRRAATAMVRFERRSSRSPDDPLRARGSHGAREENVDGPAVDEAEPLDLETRYY